VATATTAVPWGMDFRILGHLEVSNEGDPVRLGGSKQRALLAMLLLHANEPVSVDTLVDELWSDDPHESAAKNIQVQISAPAPGTRGGATASP